MILEIDAGNSRIKWRCLNLGVVVGSGALLAENAATLCDDIERIGPPSVVYLSCVSRAEIAAEFAKLADSWGAKLIKAESAAEAFGVRNGYRTATAMGVDRWLAIVAAYQQVKNACVVVDAGSAITLDLIDKAGRHLGGYIVPGFGLMNKALYSGTSGVKVEQIRAESTSPGQTTADAVNHGLLLMVLGLIEEAAKKLPGSSANIILTGGDAPLLLEHFPGRATVVADLVLDGLSLVAGIVDGEVSS